MKSYAVLHNTASCFTGHTTLDEALADFQQCDNNGCNVNFSAFDVQAIKNLIRIHYSPSRRKVEFHNFACPRHGLIPCACSHMSGAAVLAGRPGPPHREHEKEIETMHAQERPMLALLVKAHDALAQRDPLSAAMVVIDWPGVFGAIQDGDVDGIADGTVAECLQETATHLRLSHAGISHLAV